LTSGADHSAPDFSSNYDSRLFQWLSAKFKNHIHDTQCADFTAANAGLPSEPVKGAVRLFGGRDHRADLLGSVKRNFGRFDIGKHKALKRIMPCISLCFHLSPKYSHRRDDVLDRLWRCALITVIRNHGLKKLCRDVLHFHVPQHLN
jgi:hypothetical protein